MLRLIKNPLVFITLLSAVALGCCYTINVNSGLEKPWKYTKNCFVHFVQHPFSQ